MRWSGLVPCGALLVVLSGLLGQAGDLRHGGFPQAALLYFAAALLFLLSLVVVRGASREGGDLGDRGLLLILAVGVLARLLLAPGEPSLSTDFYRYVWEGQVQLAGFNPYAVAPADPALAGLRDGVYARVNHPEIPAIYGPLLQLVFAAVAWVGGWALRLKVVFLLADLAVALCLLRLLRRRGLPLAWVVTWWWHPLVLLEVAGQGHLEVVPVALLVGAVEAYESGCSRAASLALGAAVAAKYLPVLLLPVWICLVPGWGPRLRRLGWTLAPVVLCGLPYLLGGAGGEGLVAYGERWRFNEGVFGVFDAALRGVGISQAFCRHVLPLWPGVEVPPGFDPAEHQNWLQLPPKLLVGVLLCVWIGWGLLRLRRGSPPSWHALAFQAGALFLALSPVVHPWYALWVVPFLVLEAGRAAWLYLSLSLPWAYSVLLAYDGTPPTWREPPWVRWVEYLPWGLLLAWGLTVRWRNGDRQGARSALPPALGADKTGNL
jgi:hypothetical protein